ncbi:hypothetical protein [Mycoplasmopsis canis]|uniref:hypothetical protein n=1 Tax=Mycoplasmopsis canis TaxID=29555 RepID=UPI001F232C58|nr:hypothetical protein [Mycoplasmopsis canis]
MKSNLAPISSTEGSIIKIFSYFDSSLLEIFFWSFFVSLVNSETDSLFLFF